MVILLVRLLVRVSSCREKSVTDDWPDLNDNDIVHAAFILSILVVNNQNLCFS